MSGLVTSYITLVHLQHAALLTSSDNEESEDSHSDIEVRQTLDASDESNESDAVAQEFSDQGRYECICYT